MDSTISRIHGECQNSFEDLCRRLGKKKHEFAEQLEDELDRYKVWAGNVGAAHSGTTFKYSLDYRLRETTLFRDQVATFLKILKENVEKAAQSLDTESGCLNPTAETPGCNSDGGDDSPWDISSSSDEETEEKKTPKRQHMQTFQHQHLMLFPSHADRDSGDITSRHASIKTVITCLYKLPVRRPAPIDRLKDKSTETTAHFYVFDLSYVKDKFPHLDPDVAARLAKMTTRRRQLLEYRKSHQQNITPPIRTEEMQHNSPVVRKNSEEHGIGNSESGHRTSYSKATTLHQLPPPDPLGLLAPSVVGSEAQDSIFASEATRELKIEVPPRPRNDKDGSFKTTFCCPYCQIAVTISSDDKWKQHILTDLQPYVCTHRECSLPDHLFDNRDDWYAHEVQEHRIHFACGDDNHEPYLNQLEFEAHMERAHAMQLSKSPSLLYNFRRPTQAPGGICNLCTRKTNSLKRHVARHLEQVALFSIPRANYGDDEDLNESQGSISHGNAKGSVSIPGSNSDSDDDVEGSSHDPLVTIEQPQTEEDDVSVLEQEEQVDVPECSDPLWDRISTKYYDASATSFHGWSFRKEREPGVEATWARARKTPLPYSSDELQRIVNRTTTNLPSTSSLRKKRSENRTVPEQYNSLRSPHQRALIDGLLERVRDEEHSPSAEWSLACIEQEVHEYIRKGFGKVREVREMRVVLRRRGPGTYMPVSAWPGGPKGEPRQMAGESGRGAFMDPVRPFGFGGAYGMAPPPPPPPPPPQLPPGPPFPYHRGGVHDHDTSSDHPASHNAVGHGRPKARGQSKSPPMVIGSELSDDFFDINALPGPANSKPHKPTENKKSIDIRRSRGPGGKSVENHEPELRRPMTINKDLIDSLLTEEERLNRARELITSRRQAFEGDGTNPFAAGRRRTTPSQISISKIPRLKKPPDSAAAQKSRERVHLRRDVKADTYDGDAEDSETAF